MHIDPIETRRVGDTIARSGRGAALSLRGVHRAYGARTVLAGIDLELAAGEFVAIVGRSGCGKSTLLRAIAGLEAVDAGTIAGAGELRIMFQEARLLPWKSVVDNVAIGLANARERALAALSAVGLYDRASDWPARLSGGQRQRVALARALVHEPALLLLDEPLGALDALTRLDMQQLIESLWTAQRFTAVLVTHDVHEAVALADRVLLIDNGTLALDIAIDVPRPRRHASVACAALEQRILHRLLGGPAHDSLGEGKS